MISEEFKTNHRLNFNDPFYANLVQNPQLAGLTEQDLAGMHPQQRMQTIIGEYLFLLWRDVGQLTSQILFNSQWAFKTPEWFDHRHHFLHPEKWLPDYVTESADNILRVLPLGGKVLNLCSGDGFYDYYFFRHRASEITSVERGQEAYAQAQRMHSAPNITYVCSDIFAHSAKENYYDMVVIRGALEHFLPADQEKIFAIAHRALKDGGWFCGDTPEKKKATDGKHLPSHEHEYENEEELCKHISTKFSHVESMSFASNDIPPAQPLTTLFWRARK